MLLNELVVRLYTQYSHAASDVDALLTDKQYEDIRRLTHSIKGSSANLGLLELSKAAADVEQLTKAGSVPRAQDISPLKNALSDLPALEQAFSPGPVTAQDQTSSNTPALLQGLDRINATLHTDTAAAQEQINQLITQWQSSEYGLLILEIRQALYQFDTDEAKAAIIRLREKI